MGETLGQTILGNNDEQVLANVGGSNKGYVGPSFNNLVATCICAGRHGRGGGRDKRRDGGKYVHSAVARGGAVKGF